MGQLAKFVVGFGDVNAFERFPPEMREAAVLMFFTGRKARSASHQLPNKPAQRRGMRPAATSQKAKWRRAASSGRDGTPDQNG